MKQLKLKLNDPRYRRPMMTVDAAKGILDCTEDEIVEWVEVQRALVAWNIASPGAARRELRLLTRSVSEFIRDNPQRDDCYYCAICPDIAIAAVLPDHQKPWLTGLEVQRSLNCGSTHVIGLVESKLLKLMPGTNYQRGPGGSPSISRDSFVAFLKSRIEGAPYA